MRQTERIQPFLRFGKRTNVLFWQEDLAVLVTNKRTGEPVMTTLKSTSAWKRRSEQANRRRSTRFHGEFFMSLGGEEMLHVVYTVK